MAPNGTRPISTCPPDSFSHNNEPVLIPMMNIASSVDISLSSPPRTVSEKLGICTRKVAPKNQNQEIPRTLLSTTRFSLMKRIFLTVSAMKFQLIFRSGATAGKWGCHGWQYSQALQPQGPYH